MSIGNDFDPFNGFTEEERKALEKIDDEWFAKQMNTYDVGSIPFNSDAFDTMTKQKYEWLDKINPKANNFRWIVRNQIMIQRVKNTYHSNPGKKILCVVGADHNYIFKEELSNEPIELIYPLR